MLKIFFICYRFPILNLGGMQIHALTLCKGITDRGHIYGNNIYKITS